jgi:hypothetical protein
VGGGGGRGGKRDTVPVPKVKEREQGAAPPARKPRSPDAASGKRPPAVKKSRKRAETWNA